MPYPRYGNKFLNSFFPYITKIWNSLPASIQSLNLKDFKTELKSYLKPSRVKHFAVGQKDLNSIFTRFRTGRSGLNADKFSIGQIDNPSCMCHFKCESSEHFILDCFLYSIERQTLFSLVAYYIPRFLLLTRKEKFIILTEGVNNLNPEFYYTNLKISLAVQNFISKTKRFS